jgi:hypothetical protein
VQKSVLNDLDYFSLSKQQDSLFSTTNAGPSQILMS